LFLKFNLIVFEAYPYTPQMWRKDFASQRYFALGLAKRNCFRCSSIYPSVTSFFKG